MFIDLLMFMYCVAARVCLLPGLVLIVLLVVSFVMIGCGCWAVCGVLIWFVDCLCL